MHSRCNPPAAPHDWFLDFMGTGKSLFHMIPRYLLIVVWALAHFAVLQSPLPRLAHSSENNYEKWIVYPALGKYQDEDFSDRTDEIILLVHLLRLCSSLRPCSLFRHIHSPNYIQLSIVMRGRCLLLLASSWLKLTRILRLLQRPSKTHMRLDFSHSWLLLFLPSLKK